MVYILRMNGDERGNHSDKYDINYFSWGILSNSYMRTAGNTATRGTYRLNKIPGSVNFFKPGLATPPSPLWE